MKTISSRLNGHDTGMFHRRFKVLFAIVCVALSLLALRMWYLQVIKAEELKQKSENNSIRIRKIKPLRGLIMDANRNVLVDNQCSFDILYMPTRARDIHDITNSISLLYAEEAMTLSREALNVEKVRPFVPVRIEKNISREKLAIVETHSLDLPGLTVDVVPVRKYIGGEVVAHIVGYTGEVGPDDLAKEGSQTYSVGDIIGKSGIEKYLDPYLRGRNGVEQSEVNVLGKPVRVLGRVNPESGCNVVLTVDAKLQKAAWDALNGRAGAVAAIDPRDGSVLALVSSPSFDPTLFNSGISLDDWQRLSEDPDHPMENRAVSGQYPPGSTYKMIVAAAALQEGLITPETAFHCDGSFALGNRTFRCWQKHGHGRVSLHRAIVESCDVYFYNLGKLVGVDRLAGYARAFGFGLPTGVSLPREKGGLIPTKAWKQSRFRQTWQLGETISIAIGQGFNLVTPLQLVSAYGALANGGTLWRPRLVKQIEAQDGRVLEVFQPERKSLLPIDPQHVEILRKALWGVVNEPGGTGRALQRPEADVAGKTGTSQVVGLPQEEKMRKMKQIASRHRDHALFVCFAPVDEPEIAVAVIVEHGGHGGSAAAPVARKVVDAYFESRKGPDRKPHLVISRGAAPIHTP